MGGTKRKWWCGVKGKWLVCGSRNKFNKKMVFDKLDEIMRNQRALHKGWKPEVIIEGCCPNSADVWAEKWAIENDVKVLHHPSEKGGYLNRNIEMVKKAELVIAFWDGYSYGTAHTIAQAIMRDRDVIVYHIHEFLGGGVE